MKHKKIERVWKKKAGQGELCTEISIGQEKKKNPLTSLALVTYYNGYCANIHKGNPYINTGDLSCQIINSWQG